MVAGRNAAPLAASSGSSRLEVENARLKETVNSLDKKFNDLGDTIAWMVTDLDLAKGGIRIFNCQHENFRDSES